MGEDIMVPAPSPSPLLDVFAEFEQDVIAYDPFAGDFGEGGDRILSDKMVKAAKAHDDCHICGGAIKLGERHRYRAEIFDGEMHSFRWCWACCTAMARVWNYDDNGDEICSRQDLHREGFFPNAKSKSEDGAPPKDPQP